MLPPSSPACGPMSMIQSLAADVVLDDNNRVCGLGPGTSGLEALLAV
jgi:hypothetical protein